MEINQNKVVALNYKLEVNGNVADQSAEGKPLEFIFGTGMLLPKFEENIHGLVAGDKYQFHLTAAEGYGEIETEAIMDLPKDIFIVDGQLRDDLLFVGNIIPMSNSMGGIMQGKVLEIKEDVVVMDFNHVMAGKELDFSGEIVSVREATEEEIEFGLFGERRPHEHDDCGGGCDCCSGCH